MRDHAYGHKAHEARSDASDVVGNDGAAASLERNNAHSRNFFRRLHAAFADDAGAGDVEEFAFRGAGTERGDVDAEAGNFLRQAEGEEAIECLGGGVSGEIGKRLKAGGGRGDEHPTTAALDHGRHKEPGDAHHGFAVDADLAEFLFGGIGVKGAEEAEAGVVDEDIDFDAPGGDGVKDLPGCGGVVEIGNDGSDLYAVCGEFRGERFEALAAARGEHEMNAAPGEFARKGNADAGACASDEGPAAGERRMDGHGGIRIADEAALRRREDEADRGLRSQVQVYNFGMDQQHWETVYRTKTPDEVSWYCPHLESSIAMIERAARENRGASIVDVGGGASTLVDDLLARGYGRITVLDIAEGALQAAKHRVGNAPVGVQWVCADVLNCELPAQSFDIWHDRAVFHFLTEPRKRFMYVRQLERLLRSGGHVIMATFGPDGPKRCSGLETARYDAESLAAQLGSRFEIVESATELHTTPSGAIQQFLYCHFVLVD